MCLLVIAFPGVHWASITIQLLKLQLNCFHIPLQDRIQVAGLGTGIPPISMTVLFSAQACVDSPFIRVFVLEELSTYVINVSMMDYMGGLKTAKRSAENRRIDARLFSLSNTPSVCPFCTGTKNCWLKSHNIYTSGDLSTGASEN